MRSTPTPLARQALMLMPQHIQSLDIATTQPRPAIVAAAAAGAGGAAGPDGWRRRVLREVLPWLASLALHGGILALAVLTVGIVRGVIARAHEEGPSDVGAVDALEPPAP